MLNRLNGIKSLQIKILMYCLGSETADIMRPIVKKINAIIQENPDSQITAWNYYMPSKDSYTSVYKKANMPNYEGYIVNRELRLARCIEDKEFERHLNNIKNVNLRLKYERYCEQEMIYGTPTAIIMKNYMTKLQRQGLHLRENETLWAKYSYGQLLDKYRNPMISLSKRIQNDLYEAMDKYIANF